MSVDLTKLILDTNFDAFKQNNTALAGTKVITGSTAAGLNTRTFSVVLPSTPDIIDIVFNGPAVSPRPVDGWFKQGEISVPTNNAFGGNPSIWRLYSSISGTTLTITALYVQQFVGAEVLTDTTFSYRVINYSVF